MFSWFLSFLLIAIAVAILGFGGFAGMAAGIAEVLAALFFVIAMGILAAFLRSQDDA